MPAPSRSQRMLAAVLFTDIVNSTQLAEKLGDRRWKVLLDRHNAAVRRELKRFAGRELDTAGDGFFASFREPASAIACACAAVEAVRELGIEIRAGIHFGESEPAGRKLAGITVVVGARIAGLAGPGDVFVSGTAADLSRGAGFGFEDRGVHTLKGVEGEWRVLAATSVDGQPRAAPASSEDAEERLAAATGIAERGARRSRTWIAVAAAAVLASIAVILFASLSGGSDEVLPGPDSVARIDTEADRFDRIVHLGDGSTPGGVAVGANRVWVTNVAARTVLALDDAGDARPFGTSSAPTGIVFAGDRAWVTFGFGSDERGRIQTLDPVDPVLQPAPFTVPDGSYPIATGGGKIWVADPLGSTITWYEPTSDETGSFDLPLGSGPVDAAVGTAGSSTVVWVAAGREPAVYRFDPEDPGSAVERFGTGDDIPTALAVAADGTAWVVSEQSDSVLAIGADGTTRVHEVLGDGCDGPTDVAVTGDQVWAACGASRAVVRLRPADGSIADSLAVGGTPVSITPDGRGALWVAVQDR